MNEYEIALKIISVIVFITVFVLMRIIFYYKNKCHDIRYELNYEIDRRDTEIIKLKNLIDYQQETIKLFKEKLKEPEKIFKIEKVVMLPKEITCKFEISNQLALVDAECLKRHALDALADYIIREYDNNPSLFNIQQKQDPITNSTNFTLNVRLLPYPEQSDTFETICKEMEEQS